PLATLHATLDDPVQRTAIKQLVDALGDHARRVEMLSGKTGAPFFLEPQRDPVFKVLDAFGADAEFDEVKCHALNLARNGPPCSAYPHFPQAQHSTTLTASPPRLVSL